MFPVLDVYYIVKWVYECFILNKNFKAYEIFDLFISSMIQTHLGMFGPKYFWIWFCFHWDI